MPDLIGLRAYSRHRGCSLRAVQKAIASKRISTIDGKIDPAVADIQWDQNTDPAQRARGGGGAPGRGSREAPADSTGQSLPSPGSNVAYLDSRARREDFEARSAELDYLERAGLLVSTTEVRETMFKRYRTLRDKLLNIPDRIASVIAVERDPVLVHQALTAELKRVLQDLVDDARIDPQPRKENTA